MPQDENKSFSPIMAMLIGAAVGAAATYFMRKDSRDNAVKQYKNIKSNAEKVLDQTKKKIDTTKNDLQDWAQEMGEKAEEEAQRIDSKVKGRKSLTA